MLLSFQLDATFSPNMHICHSSCHPFDGFLMPHKDANALKCDSTVQMQPEKPVDDFQCCSVASPNTLWLQFKEKTTYFPIKSQSMTDLEVYMFSYESLHVVLLSLNLDLCCFEKNFHRPVSLKRKRAKDMLHSCA